VIDSVWRAVFNPGYLPLKVSDAGEVSRPLPVRNELKAG